MGKRDNELLPGTLELMVLKVVARRADHGYGIARDIKKRSQEVLQVEEGTLYPALHRLEKKGMLTARWEKSESNRRAKYYSITELGRSHLAKRQKRWKQVSAAVNHVLGARPT